MSLLVTEALTVGIGKRVLIESLNWVVHPGEFWVVLGRNGSGKSSLLFTLSGLLPRVSGQIGLAQKALDQLTPNELARHRGLMQQVQTDVFPHSVLEAVMAGRTPYRIDRRGHAEEDALVVEAALQRVGLQALRHADVTRLSGGERQRVALAALIAQQPQLFLMDEPTSHQDPGRQVAVMQIARELSNRQAVIATCHDINLAARFATHLLILGSGQHWLGSVENILTPDTLQAAFGCQFHLRGDAYFVE